MTDFTQEQTDFVASLLNVNEEIGVYVEDLIRRGFSIDDVKHQFNRLMK